MQRWLSSFALAAMCLTGPFNLVLAAPTADGISSSATLAAFSSETALDGLPAAPVESGAGTQVRALDYVRSAVSEHAAQVADNTSALVTTAMGFLGVRYRRGGNSAETGFDCSGFVRAIYQKTAGLVLPRQAKDQAQSTEVIDRSDLQPGDLVFFNTMRRAFSHVGVYLGDGKFIHSPRTGQEVRVESLQAAYWKQRFNGARRVALGDAASSQLALSGSASPSR